MGDHMTRGEWRDQIIAIFDRLFAEVTRLRARNDRLEAVAKAASESRCCRDSALDGHDCGRADIKAAIVALETP